MTTEAAAAVTTLGRRCEAVTDWITARPRRWIIPVGILLLVQIGPWFYTAPDSVCYLSIARSFWEPDGPRSLGNRFLFYPPGYPLLLAPAFLVDDRPFAVIGCLQVALAIVMAIGIYRWALPLGREVAVFAVLVTVGHACFGLYFRRPLSETAFMAELFWSGIVLNRACAASEFRRQSLWAVAATLSIVATCQLRPNGIVLAPGFVAALAWQARHDRRRLRNAVLIGGAVCLVAVGLFLGGRALDDARAATDRGVTYWDYLTKIQPTGETIIDRATEGMRIQMLEFLRLAIPGALKTHAKSGDWGSANTWLSIAVTLPLLVGWLRLMRIRPDALAWTMPFYLGLNVLWSADQGGRYTLPIWPIAAVGLWLIVDRSRLPMRRLLVPVVMLHVAVAVGYWLAIDLPRTRAANDAWPNIDRLAAAIDADRDRVASLNLTGDELNLLRLSLDRQVHDWQLDAAAGRPSIVWVAGPATAEQPPGFAPVADAGPLRLWRRSE